MEWNAVRGVYTAIAPKPTDVSAVPKQSAVPKRASLKNGDKPHPQSDGKSTFEIPPETSVALSVPFSASMGQAGAISAAKIAFTPKKGSHEERKAERDKRRTEDGCFRPRSALKKKADGTYARPRGRAPPGMVWDNQLGIFSPKRKTKGKQTDPVSKNAPKEAVSSNALEPTDKSPPEEAVSDASKGAVSSHAAEPTVETSARIETPSVVTPADELKVLPVGTLVNVAERVWIGSNKAGGIGTVINYEEMHDGTVLYDVKYSLGGKEKGIDGRFVARHDFSGCGSVMRSASKT
jgi:hypothetical protein